MPTAAELYNEHETLKNEGHYEQAMEKLEECLAEDESYVLGHLGASVLLSKLGKHEDAVRHAQRACELDPSDPFNFTSLSVTFQRAYAGTQNQQFIQLAEDAMARARMLEAGG